jgi:riboflavin synthase
VFTGLVQSIGRLQSVSLLVPNHMASGVRVVVAASVKEWGNVQLGESIAINGACMTVVAFDEQGFTVDVSYESLQCTAPWQEGSFVNLERALRVGDSIGGHWVSGHVDGTGRIETLMAHAESYLLKVSLPDALAKHVITKGSITVHGVSLTINQVEKLAQQTLVSINLIAHTWQHTAFQYLSVGDAVNIEVDLMAKQVHHYIEHYKELDHAG